MAVRRTSSRSPITVDSVAASDFQKEGTLTAQLRQVITNKAFYPSKSVDNNMSDNIFAESEFGFEEQEFESEETRVAWLLVPEGTTPEAVLARLAQKPGAMLYKVLANQPILTDDQLYSISIGQRTKDDYANSQVVRYPEGHENAGAIILDEHGKVQYRKVFFSSTAKEDMDLRNADPNNMYQSAEIAAELNQGVIPENAHVVNNDQVV